ncbi:TonB family protein [Sandaracinobacter sp. RS1-74]|uniref:TonB family protein n=1 Tax=Sandaracinobacteroides sayramensis TaxID=2913411 RepID=UPI001EDB2764|nr:TonB family protein [Sandaracinobacteroides sayramensis]MCG2841233.1 TonB family protein [Sandaracinobacteroides sayramensis]
MRLRHALSAALMLASLWPDTPARAQADEQAAPATHDYDIPAQPLERALVELGTVSHIDILYGNGVVDAKRSNPLVGSFSQRDAIATMLRGTGLEFRFTRLNAVVIFPPDQPPAPGIDAWVKAEGTPRLVLDVLRVTAPPMIGTPPKTQFEPFGRAVQAAINDRLQTDPRTSKRPFRARLTVHIDASGVLRRPEVVRSTGNAKLDADIRKVLDGAQMPGQPPEGLPQPVWFEVAAR